MANGNVSVGELAEVARLARVPEVNRVRFQRLVVVAIATARNAWARAPDTRSRRIRASDVKPYFERLYNALLRMAAVQDISIKWKGKGKRKLPNHIGEVAGHYLAAVTDRKSVV